MAGLGFLLKKLLGFSLLPAGLVFWLGLVGLVIWLARPRRRLGPGLVVMALVLFVALSLPVTGWLLLKPLEQWAGGYAQPGDLASLGVRDVVVLSGGASPGSRHPVDRMGSETLRRTFEGVRLWRELPGARLILSGGAFTDQQLNIGELMASLAQELGVPEEAITVEGKSWDTADQARLLAAELKDRPFALVTSASHMPRALFIFREKGLYPVPAPADFKTLDFEPDFMEFIPQASGLGGSQTAFYEYWGNLWVRLKSLW